MPQSPVVELSASQLNAPTAVLTAGTYGRGIWQTPLWTAKTGLTFAALNPDPLSFATAVPVNSSSQLPLAIENTGSAALTPTSIAASGDFSYTDPNHCLNHTVAAGASCFIEVTFAPTETGTRTGQMTIYANVYGGQLGVDLSGSGDCGVGDEFEPG